MIEGDRRLIIREIAEHVGISYRIFESNHFRWFGLPTSVDKFLVRRRGTFLASWRNIRKLTVLLCTKDFRHYIELRGKISWGTLSPMMRHHYTQGPKQVTMEWRKPGEEAPRKAKTRLSAGKVLSTFFRIVEAYCSLIFSTEACS